MKLPLVSILAIVLSGAPVSRGATVWMESEARLDETVADSQTLPPPNPLQPLLARTPFSNFRYPHVDAEEDVTFIADDPAFSRQTAHHGIYRSLGASGELRPLIRQNETAVPGTSARLRWLRGLQVSGTDFVFNATDTERRRGLYHWSAGALTTIVRSGVTTLPDVSVPVSDVEYGAQAGNRVLYVATAGEEELLVLHELKTGRARVILRTDTPLPDQPGIKFRYFSRQNWLDERNVVFRAASVKNPHQRGGADAGKRGLYGWLEVDWSQPDRAFDPTRLITFADGRTPVPGLAEGTRFDDFRSAPVRDGLVAFVGGAGSETHPSFQGIYYCDLKADGGKTVRAVVDTESKMQGLFEGAFTGFDIWCTVFDRSIVFVGYAADEYAGVFLYRTDSDALFLLCDNRTAMGEKRVKDFEIASDFLVRNRFAVALEFEDDTYGVYLATIPPRSYKRMTAATQ